MATIEEIEDLGVEVLNGESESDEGNGQAVVVKPPSPQAEAPVAVAVAEPKRPTVPSKAEEIDDDEDEDFDETLFERLVGLTEMFPESVRTGVSKLFFGSIGAVKGLYSFGRSASWIFFSSSAILFAPVLFEIERAQMEEMQKQQQRQILLGPGAAVSGGPPGMPGMAPAPPRH